ncbi:MAG: DNA-directed RNA polymerase subunit beta [Planctomycetia bacterium]
MKDRKQAAGKGQGGAAHEGEAAAFPIPNLVELQTSSYKAFLQEELDGDCRQPQGLEALLREIFPIESFDKTKRLEYVRYELGVPRYTLDECRDLKLTYGRPFKVSVRLSQEQPVEEEVFLGELPIMIGGGEFLVNGTERTIVAQMHRSPGVDFSADVSGVSRIKLFKCSLIPERGSWIEFNVTKPNVKTKRDHLQVRIDKSGKFPATVLLRAMNKDLSSNAQIVRAFYATETFAVASRGFAAKVVGTLAVLPVVDPKTGEVIVEELGEINDKAAELMAQCGVESVEVITDLEDRLILNTLLEDTTKTHEEALGRIYARLRPGDQVQGEKAKELLRERFFDPSRYRLGRVGRFRLNRKFGTQVPEDQQALSTDELILVIKYFEGLRPYKQLSSTVLRARGGGKVKREGDKVSVRQLDGRTETYAKPAGGQWLVGDEEAVHYGQALAHVPETSRYHLDDIDHLGNRRIRTISELLCEELRKGFYKLKRTAQERMSQDTAEPPTPRSVVNSKTISSVIDYFFSRGELSQVVDQTNPLSQITHERRLSALGPGGLNRKRATLAVRDVNISHYGRICPIETPEGANIGLIASLSVYSGVDAYGFLVTPYRVVEGGRVTGELVHLRADEETDLVFAGADTQVDDAGRILTSTVLGRKNDDFLEVSAQDVRYMDVSPMQLVGVSAALIPFLEHDDANRALMGSNMQRQAVPLLVTEPPLVGTGMERIVAAHSSMVVRTHVDGEVVSLDSRHVTVKGEDGLERRHDLRKFQGLNERTCLNQRPVVAQGQRVKAGQVLADGAATHEGELALGRNVLVAFMPWDGYNYEDAILVSEDLVRRDAFTSIHIDMFELEVRETKHGREEFTPDIPNVSERALRNLGDDGSVRVGTRVRPGDILVGKVAPKLKTELSPEEKLLHAIFGQAGEDVKNESLTVPPGIDGIVIHTLKLARTAGQGEDDRADNQRRIRDEERDFARLFHEQMQALLEGLVVGGGKKLVDPTTRKPFSVNGVENPHELREVRERLAAALRGAGLAADDPARGLVRERFEAIDHAEARKNKVVNTLARGDELQAGVLEVRKVWIATRRNLSVGDKMAGRHGNKGVISRILPVEDMPFLEDGTPVDIVLNPLGVPSRMNVGQILETHLGFAAKVLGLRVKAPVFTGQTHDDISVLLGRAGLPADGKVRLLDGRTGVPFDQKVTVGYLYMLKLHHLVDEKIHARATGPYSLITQQPLGGKARFGGQRFGEMEVWALEAYGAASVLQELLTVKSDDVDGRMKIYEAMVKGENVLDAGTPVSFEVLCNEIKGLGLNIELKKSHLGLGTNVEPGQADLS